jgi:hypothetical protein
MPLVSFLHTPPITQVTIAHRSTVRLYTLKFIMGIVIHGVSKATCTQRVLATLIEKGVTDYELKTIDMRAREHKVIRHEFNSSQ